MTWTTQSNTLSSKGQLTKKATRLADLASRRELTNGQFFTPLWISEKVWDIASQAMESGRKYNVMDNSVGSGRLLAHANPEAHNLFGCDIDHQFVSQAFLRQHLLNSVLFNLSRFHEITCLVVALSNIRLSNIRHSAFNHLHERGRR